MRLFHLNIGVSDESHIDVEAVKRNAAEQGVRLSEVAIFYDGLTDDEKDFMREQNLITHDNGGSVIAKFTNAGEALFQQKIKGFHSLAA
jgi:hypothetical protein